MDEPPEYVDEPDVHRSTDMDYKRAHIPQRFWDLKLEDIQDTYDTLTTGLSVKEQAHRWMTDAKNHVHVDGVGLLFTGPPGTGKTMLASLIGMNLVDQGYSVCYITLSAYIHNLLNMIDLKEAWSHQDDVDAYEDWKSLRTSVLNIRNSDDLVIIDDVGKEHTTNSRYVEDEFDFMVRRRYDKALPTIMTSNVPPDKWEGKYSEAMQSFIQEAFIAVEMTGSDRRRAGR